MKYRKIFHWEKVRNYFLIGCFGDAIKRERERKEKEERKKKKKRDESRNQMTALLFHSSREKKLFSAPSVFHG